MANREPSRQAAWQPGNLGATSTTVSYVMLGHLMLKYEDTDTSSLSQQAGFLLAALPPSLPSAINKNARKLSTATKLSTINSPPPPPRHITMQASTFANIDTYIIGL